MRIAYLRWNDAAEEHIARHGVLPAEVEEVVEGAEFHLIRLRNRRYGLIGQTLGRRYLSIVVERLPDGVFFVVTARPADPDERRLYMRHRNRHWWRTRWIRQDQTAIGFPSSTPSRKRPNSGIRIA